MSPQLPQKPSLEHLKKQAKDLLCDFELRQPAAIERFRSVSSSSPKLADAQHVIARDYGFASWTKLKEHVDTVTRELQPKQKLAAAVRASDADRVEQTLAEQPELKAQINEPMFDYGGMQALLAAVQRTDRKTIDVLLRAGADINARSRSSSGGIGVLDECAPELAEFLIERGAIVDAHSAARLGLLQKLEELVIEDPNVVHARGWNGQTPLHFASTVAIAEYLLEHGAEIDACDLQHESTPAQHMLRVVQARHYPRDRQQIARYFITQGCRTDILMAAALGDLALVRRHVENDPGSIRTRVNDVYFPKQNPQSGGTIYIYQFGRGRTPHQIARDFGHEQVFEFLMQHSSEDVKMEQAFELGDEKMFRALLASRPHFVATLADPDKRRLTDAAQNNNTAAVRLMLSAGWPVDTKGEYAMTPLEWASWHGNAEMVREILRYGPQIEHRDNEHGITALGSALHGSMNGWHRDTGDYVATVEALLEAGAKAPEVTDDLEASAPVKELLRERTDVA
ncbi:MAG TPA: ankyrin repeat domain-containing protein [Terriglobales bacterium]